MPSRTQTIAAVEATVSARLLNHEIYRPDELAFTFLKDGEEPDASLTWCQVAQRARIIAGELSARHLTGERVLLVMPPGLDFVCAFLACLLSGTVAVPLAPPSTRRLLERTRAVVADCRARAVLAAGIGQAGVDELSMTEGLDLVFTDRCSQHAGYSAPRIDDPAMLQYTSGSTGAPRGVVLTHGNLAKGSEYIQMAISMVKSDVVINWLPVLHDMGLIGSVVQVTHMGQHSIHMSPQAMLRKPIRWLRAIHRWRGTVTGGPDFAWRLLADRLSPEDLAGLDLSCVRVAYSGAEPVRLSTLERTGALLGTAGFDARAWLPCYGLAEATLPVTGGPAWRDVQVSSIAGLGNGKTYVDCGRPNPAGTVAVVDSASGERCMDGEVGEIWVSGPHVARGYWNRPRDTMSAFGARLSEDPRAWLRTGDLGFMRADHLYVTGRIKDLLIVNGRKHHPEDVEMTIQDRVSDCRSGACAVFQVEDGDSQCSRLVAAIEMTERPGSDAETRALLSRVSAAVWSRHELVVDAVVPVRLGALPRTTSGKVRRGEARNLYVSGLLSRSGHVAGTDNDKERRPDVPS